MAASFYKWLSIPVMLIILTSATLKKPHPFHVTVTEINHNAGDKDLEISCKIFTDDFEKILAKNYKTKVDLGKEEMKHAMDSLVKKYIASHLVIRVNNKILPMTYVGFETEKEATYGYFEIDNVAAVSRIDIANSILYDSFDDEVNIMHVIVNGKRQSDKVTYPQKDISFSF